jgi:hypothetical protein
MQGACDTTRLLSVSIARSAAEVYEFLSVPMNFAMWASGLGTRLRPGEGDWIVDTAEGRAIVRFTEPNRFGVLDHSVRLPSGSSIYVPLRVVPKGEGCELMLRFFRRPGVSDEQFAADAESVMRDLRAAKRILEAREREESAKSCSG